jgi:hypothetical protein
MWKEGPNPPPSVARFKTVAKANRKKLPKTASIEQIQP